jgi:CubicO group peptidase (beta-lactamase class C family)
VSVAVADSGRIVWARGFGLKQVGTADSVDGETLFQAASISKPVTGTAMLKLVEEGKLSLDEDVNRYLKSWRFPDNEFTTKEKVTLRRLVSHTAGLTIHGFPGYEVGAPLPTIPQVLDGAKPANTGPVRAEAVPGTRWAYSGGGTTMMGLVMTDVTGEPFPALIKRLVLDPAGMTRSTFEQPLPQSRESEAATAHSQDGSALEGRWHVYPELAPDGLWTTPTDLLHWALEIAASRAGRSTKLLSQGMANQMLTVVMPPTGLGPFLEGSGRGFRFGHGGSNAGFQCDLVYFPETGQGAAIMTNGDQGGNLIEEIKLSLAAEYGWPDVAAKTIEVVSLDSAALARVTGSYLLRYRTDQFPVTVRAEGGKVLATAPIFTQPEELLPKSPLTFVGGERGYEFEFVASEGKPAGELIVRAGEGFVLRGPRQ